MKTLHERTGPGRCSCFDRYPATVDCFYCHGWGVVETSSPEIYECPCCAPHNFNRTDEENTA